MEKLKKLPIQIAVRAIVFNDEQKIMLIKRAPNTYEGGKWCLVGGKPDENESLDKAVARETLEEVGVQLPLTYYFVGNSNALPDQFDPREVSEIAFFSESELEKLDIAFDHKDVLMQFLKK